MLTEVIVYPTYQKAKVYDAPTKIYFIYALVIVAGVILANIERLPIAHLMGILP
jgi:hypothetical protein